MRNKLLAIVAIAGAVSAPIAAKAQSEVTTGVARGGPVVVDGDADAQSRVVDHRPLRPVRELCRRFVGRPLEVRKVLVVDENLREGVNYNLRQVETHFHYPDDQHSFASATDRCAGRSTGRSW